MNETILGATLAGNIILMFTLWMHIRELKRDLNSVGKDINDNMSNIEIEMPDLDALREEIIGVMSNMATPNFMDHVGGMIAQFGQARLMKTMQGSLMGEGDVHNPEDPSA